MSRYKTREEAIKAVKSDGRQLYNVDPRFKDDEEIVRLALKHGGILSHASIRLQNDPAFIVEEAKHSDGFEFNFDKALFCAKQDLALAKKFTPVYKKSDEFQIELRLHYGEKYLTPIRKYNFMSPDELRAALQSYREKQVELAREIYVRGYDSDYIQEHEELYVVAGHSALQWAAVSLREEGKPFSDILGHYPSHIEYEKKAIEEYCSESLSGSYPERLMNSLLTILGVDFAREQTFPWSTNVIGEDGKNSSKRYDFYIPSMSAIIEVHGAQHYGGGFEYLGGRSLEEEQANDKQKEQLAKENGIKHYIVINALSSTLSFIKESILSSTEFTSLFNLSDIDWDAVESGTVTKVKTDVSFPLYESMASRSAAWVDVIKASLIKSDYIALESTKRKIENTVSPELQENIKHAFPSANGLYPHELLMLKEAHYYRYPLEEKHIPGKGYYDYGIGDVSVYFEKLLQNGFLVVGDIRSAVEHSTLPVIKRVLTEHGLSTKGKKSELVELLLNNVPHDILEPLFTERYLELTEYGRKELDDNPYILTKNNYGLSIWSLNRLANAFPNDDINYILEQYNSNPRRFLTYLTEDDRQMLGIAYSEHPPTQKPSDESRKQVKVSSMSTPKQGTTSSDTQKTVKLGQQAAVSRDEINIPVMETPQQSGKKPKRVRIGWIIPGVFFAFFALIFVIIGLFETKLLFAAAFFGIFAVMFFVLALSPKNVSCILGRETGISKKAFVIICIVLAFLMPMLSNMVVVG